MLLICQACIVAKVCSRRTVSAKAHVGVLVADPHWSADEKSQWGEAKGNNMGLLVRSAIFTRWGRFLLAALFLAGAVFVAYAGIINTDIKMKTGVFVDGTDSVDKSSGAYQYSEITLSGDSTPYRLDLHEFTPKLTGDMFVMRGTVDIWYTLPADGTRHVVAVQLRDEQDQNPTKYVTSIYSNPNSERTGSFIGAGVIALFALAAALAGAFLPTSFGKKQPQPVPVAQNTSLPPWQ